MAGSPPSVNVNLFAVRKADRVLDSLGSSRTSLLLQLDTAARTLQFLSPDEREDRECYAFAAVSARSLSRCGMQLRLQAHATATPTTRQLTFVSTAERDQCLATLEQLCAGPPSPGDNHPARGTEGTVLYDDTLVESIKIDQAMAGEIACSRVHGVVRLVRTTRGHRTFAGVLTATNYRVVFSPYNQADAKWSFEVPRSTVDSIDRDGAVVQLQCRDIRCVRLAMHDAYATTRRDNQGVSSADANDRLSVWIQDVAPPTAVSAVFAFVHHAVKATKLSIPHNHNGWLLYSPIVEYQRLGLLQRAGPPNPSESTATAWRLLPNSKFRFSPTYPQLFVVPMAVTEAQLVDSGRFRSHTRLPVVTWRHPDRKCVLARSSQPNYGLLGNRCDSDRTLLKAYRDAADKTNGSGSSGEAPALRIIDARDLVAATGNRVMGKGVEKPQHYNNAVVEFVGIANLHKMRESFEALKSLILSDGKNFHSRLEKTKWLQHSISILNGARRVAHILHHDGASVLVHGSDGWDRTAQLVGLAQLLLDPYYRTLHGFVVLIEKEWCSFGHKYTDRIGVGKDATVEDPHERSPVMLQFLDCVWQLLRQFPTAFEFNETLLLHVWDALASGLYGTFLYNTERERISEKVWERTESAWTPVLEDPKRFTNATYTKTEGVLYPRTDETSIALWEAFVFRWDIERQPRSAEIPSQDHLHVEHTGAEHHHATPTTFEALGAGRGRRSSIDTYLDDSSWIMRQPTDSKQDYVVGPAARAHSEEALPFVGAMGLTSDDQFELSMDERSRQRKQARTICEALATAPDNTRIKYLEQLLRESLAREVDVEKALQAVERVAHPISMSTKVRTDIAAVVMTRYERIVHGSAAPHALAQAAREASSTIADPERVQQLEKMLRESVAREETLDTELRVVRNLTQ